MAAVVLVGSVGVVRVVSVDEVSAGVVGVFAEVVGGATKRW